jgi:hypothetical protein
LRLVKGLLCWRALLRVFLVVWRRRKRNVNVVPLSSKFLLFASSFGSLNVLKNAYKPNISREF